MKRLKRILASLLVVCMVVSLIPASAFAEGEKQPIDAAVIFTDLHSMKNGNSSTGSTGYKKDLVTNFMSTMKNTGLPFSSVTSGGDAFSSNSTTNTGYTDTITGYIQSVLGDIPVNYVWSDHDRGALDNATSKKALDKTSHLSYGAGKDNTYGTDDDANYYVYSLSMADICSYDRYTAGFNDKQRASKGFTPTIKEAVENFKTEAAKLNKDKPLFIVSHQPLFDRRNDNAFAEQWFDAINEVAKEMDVTFFFGHNHKYDKDSDYYYAKGTEMPVATDEGWLGYETGAGYQGYLPTGDLKSVSKTLNFSHICAGYTDPGTTGTQTSTTREGTMVAITIFEDSIKYTTYDEDSVFDGKYALNVDVEREFANVKEEGDRTVTDEQSGTKVSAPGVTGINVSVSRENPDEELYKAYALYDIVLTGYTQGDAATVSIKLNDTSFEDGEVIVHDIEKDTTSVETLVDGVVTFETNHFSKYAIMQSRAAAEIEKVTIDSYEGTIEFGRPLSTQIGSKLTVTYTDGSTKEVPVTAEMVVDEFGNNIDITTIGTYKNLAVKYEDTILRIRYVLNVTDIEYPNPGSVNLEKSATGVDFQNTGVARVKLSAAGIPVGKGVDIVVMLDMSSSMTRCILHNNKECDVANCKTREEELEDAMEEFEATLKSSNNASNIRVAIADFNGFYSDGAIARDDNDRMSDASTLGNDYRFKGNTVYTGNKSISAGAFVPATQLDTSKFNYSPLRGTNYDYAFDTIYQLGHAIKKDNAEKNEERELYVLFMSDGAPNQYNYYHAIGGENENSGSANWNKWLQGTMTEAERTDGTGGLLEADTHAYYFDTVDHDGDGHLNEHRMANAIKGSPETNFSVIRKSRAGLTDLLTQTSNNNIYTLPGLGAKMYSIAFDIANDGRITRDSVEHVLKQIPTSLDYYYSAEEEGKLVEAFREIASTISYAASNSRFIDQMGSNYNLQMNPIIKTNATGSITTRETDTNIKVTTQAVYESHQVGTVVDGHQVTESDVGKTYGDIKTIENVTFAMKGNQLTATTTVGNYKLQDGTTVVANSTNILQDGIVCGKNFFYNSNTEDKQVKLADGTKVTVPAETFYWNIGIISATKYTIEYTVYLDGAMEGEAELGEYETNNFARLHYTNYIGKEAIKEVKSPSLEWENAQVKYAFYLVDGEGNPLREDGTKAESFADAYKVTNPELYKIFRLNNQEGISLKAEELADLSEEYALYSKNTEYKIFVGSGDGEGANVSRWEITGDKDKTTYVTGYNGENDFSNNQNEATSSYEYSNTTVWFAVKYDLELIPDTIVMDYGKDIQKDILENDKDDISDNWNAELVGFVKNDTDIYAVKPGNEAGTLDGTFGEFNLDRGKVNYSLDKMLSNVEKVVGVVKLTNKTDSSNVCYKYNLLNVIPATTMYYETDFASDVFENSPTGEAWSTVTNGPAADGPQDDGTVGTVQNTSGGTKVSDEQTYGFDSTYENDSALSNASSMFVNGAGVKKTTSKFTFTGTGFDLISRTGAAQGAIRVDIYSDSDRTNKVKGVTVLNKSESGLELYQIPVVSVNDLPYGTYYVTVGVNAAYTNEAYPQLSRGGEFYFDAIRIFNPAKGNEEAEDAYKADNEYGTELYEVRQQLLTAEDYDVEENNLPGVTFVDSTYEYDEENKGYTGPTHEEGSVVVGEYKSIGPNNEVYLAKNQGIVFEIAYTGAAPTSIDIGAKTITDGTAHIKAYVSTSETQPNAAVVDKDIKSSTAQFQQLVNKDNAASFAEAGVAYVFVTNTGEDVLSITDVKVGYSSDAAGSVAFVSNTRTMAFAEVAMAAAHKKVEAAEVKSVTTDKATYVPGETVKVSVKTNDAAEYVLINNQKVTDFTESGKVRTWKATVKAKTLGKLGITATAYNAEDSASKNVKKEVTVKNFAPKTLKLVLDKSTVVKKDTFKATVTTSEDVSYVKVNGYKVTKYTADKAKKTRTWTINLKANVLGKRTIKAVAYDKYGNASTTVSKTLTVKNFTPKTFKLDPSKNTVKKGTKYVVSVTTSKDVKYVTLNGNKVTNFTTNKKSGLRTFKVKYSATSVGKKTVKAVAYNANSSASSAKTKTVKIVKK